MKREGITSIIDLRDGEESRRALLRQIAVLSLGMPLAQAKALPRFIQRAAQLKEPQPHILPAPATTPSSH